MTFDILAQVEASDLFADENVNWEYCREEATFSHKDACEFILHIYRPGDAPDANEHHADKVQRMKNYGCTPEFIQAYEDARKAGASRVLFYA